MVVAGEVELPKDVELERARNMEEIEHEFVQGTIHALFVSRLPRPFLEGNPNIGLFFAHHTTQSQASDISAEKRELLKQFSKLESERKKTRSRA